MRAAETGDYVPVRALLLLPSRVCRFLVGSSKPDETTRLCQKPMGQNEDFAQVLGEYLERRIGQRIKKASCIDTHTSGGA